MRGNVIGFDAEANTGAISGHDGLRYDFVTLDWHSPHPPRHGDLVDFVPEGGRARQIYRLEPDDAPQTFWQFYFSLRGRIPRSQYWLKFVLPVFAISLGLGFIEAAARAAGHPDTAATFEILSGVFSLATFWPGIAVLVKRIHDRDKSGWLALLPYALLGIGLLGVAIAAAAHSREAAEIITGVVGIAGFAVFVWFFVEFGCLRGTVGSNRFGPDPVGPS